MTAEELAGIISTKLGIGTDAIDVVKDGDGWSASLKFAAGVPWDRHVDVAEVARALATHYRLR
jgi:hypothetical protein